jgi:hypothetical protein
MGFLKNYIGETHSKVLASLKNQQAVFFGRASTCEAPIVLQLNKAEAFREGFWEPLVERIPVTPAFDDLEGAAAVVPAAAGSPAVALGAEQAGPAELVDLEGDERDEGDDDSEPYDPFEDDEDQDR